MGLFRGLLALVLIAGTSCGRGFPRDPEHTTERVERDKVVRVGLTEHPPWVTREHGQPRGIEAELVEALARSRGSRVAWYWGQQDALFAALERFELDVVIGGIDRETPWSDRVGLTDVWHTQTWGVGVPKDTPAPPTLEALPVAVAPGTLAAAELRDLGARPLRTHAWRAHKGAVAAPLAYLDRHEMTIVEANLCRTQHVIAVPPGENQWLGVVERVVREVRPMLSRRIDEESR